MDKKDWVWMPHPGHLICARDCKFHLNTYVGGYIVSTVGEYFPDYQAREILAQTRGINLQGKGDARLHDYMEKIGYEKIGCDRLYETMVFRAEPSDAEMAECCPWKMADASEVDAHGYNTPGDAYKGHLAMCEKWASDQPVIA